VERILGKYQIARDIRDVQRHLSIFEDALVIEKFEKIIFENLYIHPCERHLKKTAIEHSNTILQNVSNKK